MDLVWTILVVLVLWVYVSVSSSDTVHKDIGVDQYWKNNRTGNWCPKESQGYRRVNKGKYKCAGIECEQKHSAGKCQNTFYFFHKKILSIWLISFILGRVRVFRPLMSRLRWIWTFALWHHYIKITSKKQTGLWKYEKMLYNKADRMKRYKGVY